MAAMAVDDTQFIFRGNYISDGVFHHDGVLAWRSERIEYAGPSEGFTAAIDAVELDTEPGAIAVPGLIDIHTHGAFGGDFPSADEESAYKALSFMHSHGATTVLASLVTASPEMLEKGVELFAGFAERGLIAGIHLEGPFLSHARCGAQNPLYLLNPDLELTSRLLELGRGTIVSMTYAPELPNSEALVELLCSHGVIPSLGHTDSDFATASAALSYARSALEGAGFDGNTTRPSVTHLFNGMPPMHHRSPGPVAASLKAAAENNAVAELVADNTHLAPETVLTVFTLLGRENIALITDSMAAAGLADGEYELGPSPVRVENSVARLVATGSIAGGTATLMDVVRRTHHAGIALEDAVYSATSTPAKLLGLADEVGALRAGLRADVVIMNSDLSTSAVFRLGKKL